MSLWFNLTYASYLTVPRSLLEAMPKKWQRRFYKLFSEVDEAFPQGCPAEGQHYEVHTRDETGRFVADPLREYRHPDVRLIDSLRKPRWPR